MISRHIGNKFNFLLEITEMVNSVASIKGKKYVMASCETSFPHDGYTVRKSHPRLLDSNVTIVSRSVFQPKDIMYAK